MFLCGTFSICCTDCHFVPEPENGNRRDQPKSQGQSPDDIVMVLIFVETKNKKERDETAENESKVAERSPIRAKIKPRFLRTPESSSVASAAPAPETGYSLHETRLVSQVHWQT